MKTGADRTLELLAAQVGRPLGEVETPVAVVDLDRLEANLQDLQSYADAHGIALWPHTKTHKSPEIGLRQLALGAGGLTVAKTGEAQVFQEAGAPRILVHYPPFGADKWERLAALAAGGLELTVAVDGLRRPRASRPRCSVAARAPSCSSRWTSACTARARRPPRARSRSRRRLSRLPAVEVAGISCYPGPLPRRRRALQTRVREVDALLRETRDAFAAAGMPRRPHLGRFDADPLSDARDLRQRAALGHLRAARPQRRPAREVRAVGRGDGRSRTPCPGRS